MKIDLPAMWTLEVHNKVIQSSSCSTSSTTRSWGSTDGKATMILLVRVCDEKTEFSKHPKQNRWQTLRTHCSNRKMCMCDCHSLVSLLVSMSLRELQSEDQNQQTERLLRPLVSCLSTFFSFFFSSFSSSSSLPSWSRSPSSLKFSPLSS